MSRDTSSSFRPQPDQHYSISPQTQRKESETRPLYAESSEPTSSVQLYAPAVTSEPLTKDGLGPKIWTGTHPKSPLQSDDVEVLGQDEWFMYHFLPEPTLSYHPRYSQSISTLSSYRTAPLLNINSTGPSSRSTDKWSCVLDTSHYGGSGYLSSSLCCSSNSVRQVPYSYPHADSDVGQYNSAENEAPKLRKKRNNLPKETTDILRKWYEAHSHYPYPTEEEKKELMRQTRLEMSKSSLPFFNLHSQSHLLSCELISQDQISTWFINARRRQPQMPKEGGGVQ
jgi:Homeobox KN domain